jgi:membrane associated rhomboid family serine protease
MFVASWLALNLLFAVPAISGALASGAVAWEAHLGGFIAGPVLFRLFDPVPPARPQEDFIS